MTHDLQPATATRAAERPVSPAQEQLWLQRKLYPDAALLAVTMTLRLRGPLDLAALALAVREVVHRQDMLSGWVEERDDELVHVPAEWPGELELLSLADHPGRDLPDLDLPDGRLLAARVVRLAADDHMLQLKIDHMAFDGATEHLLVDEIRTAYDAVRTGAPAKPALAATYADFAVAQRKWLDSPECRAMLDSCREALAGADDLVLHTDRPRPDRRSFRGRSHYFDLGARLAGRIKEFSVSRRVTPFMTLAAVFGVLMSRRGDGNRDFLIGIPHLGRDRPEWTDLVGLFANVVPTRVRLPRERSFTELVHAMRAETGRAITHSRLPFHTVVDALRPARELARVPLCPVTFQVRYDALPAGGSAALTLTREPATVACDFELTMTVADGGTELPVAIEYAADLFDPATISLLAEEFGTLCAALLDHPDDPVELADHHGPRHGGLLTAGTGAPAPVTSGVVHEEFRRQAAATPDAVAVVAEGGALTYSQLDAAADRLATRLVAAGVRRCDRVAVVVARDLAMPVALLGVLKAGAAYLPLDQSIPHQRMASMLATGRPTAVVTDAPSRELGESLGLPVVPVGGPAEQAAALPQVSPADLAYVMYTSGTTGEPKAVAISHQGVTSLTARPAYTSAGPGTVVSHLAPAVFDPSAIETWTALLTGSTLAVSPTSRPSPAQLHDYIRRFGVRVLFLTTGLAQLVVDERPEVFADIDHMLTGGDVLSPDHMHRIRTACPHVRLTSFYGATEIGIASSATHDDLMRPDQPVPLGLPMPGRSAHVLDADGRLASPGVPGEIVLGGDGVAYGYLGRPGLTADRFVPHPFEPGARIYRTGDVGVLGTDGVLHFLGRSDRQVKIRGHRVEPAEVDAALGTHPAVRQSLTRPRISAGTPILVGYLVTDGGPTDGELRAFLAERLPEYCVPSRFLRLPALPLTSNSKIDTDALDRLPLPAPATHGGGLTAFESAVARIWCEVLDLEAVDPDANFFVLGGHSLAAARVAARVERATGRSVPVSVVFDAPTVRGLVAWVVRSASDTAPDTTADTASESEEDVLAELIGATADEVAMVRDGLTG
ncbi:non-ribosomal peptide synthetase [Actinophytocola sp.]|uniref:non-ribosomal peptide synthetase n=1 Tax=Actinophytocola sp. TaxID=1872138 RepID=UPI003899B95B